MKKIVNSLKTFLYKKEDKNLQTYNFYLSVAIFVLTILSLVLSYKSIVLSKQQTYYTEISTRADRINQIRTINDAKERCINNPDLAESGLYSTKNGKQSTCAEVIKIYNLK